MNQHAYIDVTKLEPRLKHPTIFDAFDNLKEGESVLIHNDHDPKPVYYQLLGEKVNIFSWTYLAKGPEVWEVEIKKTPMTVKKETIGQMAAKDMRKAEVFKRNGIDFCCGGKKTVEEACAEKGLDVLRVQQELVKVSQTNAGSQHDYDSWGLSFLADYIVNVHHGYVQKNGPLLREMSQAVADHHGKTNPELNIIRDKVDEMIAELNAHMKKEERILFPYIKQIDSHTGADMSAAFGSVMQPISVMENDHDIVGALLKDMNECSNNFTAPANACNSFKFLYHKLSEFENDLHTHIHLENNILFPKAVALEQGN